MSGIVIGIEHFQETGIGIVIDIFGRAELINSIFNSTNSYLFSCSVTSFRHTRLNGHSYTLTPQFCINLTFQYIHYSYGVLHKYSRYLLAIEIICVNSTEVRNNPSSKLLSALDSDFSRSMFYYLANKRFSQPKKRELIVFPKNLPPPPRPHTHIPNNLMVPL